MVKSPVYVTSEANPGHLCYVDINLRTKLFDSSNSSQILFTNSFTL